jgi:hypothetical protein
LVKYGTDSHNFDLELFGKERGDLVEKATVNASSGSLRWKEEALAFGICIKVMRYSILHKIRTHSHPGAPLLPLLEHPKLTRCAYQHT